MRLDRFLFSISLLSFFTFFVCSSCLGQEYNGNDNYSPPSPNSVALINQINNSINLYSGTTNVDLPIGSLPGRKIAVPILLSYNTGGIKVQDVAGWTGLGWNLNAGGAITRVVRGLPDEVENGFCGINNVGEKAGEPLTAEYVKKVAVERIWDSEPDLFYFNFLGKAGKFVLDDDGNPVLLNYQNIDIVSGICGSGNGTWTIFDESGTKYIFGIDENSRESSNFKSGEVDRTYVSSWYLSSIITPSEEDNISFQYSSGPNIAYKYFIQENSITVYGTIGGCTDAIDGTTKDVNQEITVLAPKYIATIGSSKGSLVFGRSTEQRGDLPGGQILKKITFNDHESRKLYEIQLDYDYFKSTGCDTELCKRLKLNAITKVLNNSMKERLYWFEYNTLFNLPSRDSHEIDHWGYYNSNTVSSKIPSAIDPHEICGGTYSGADREADSLRSRANILERVYNGYGGYISYEYSANLYSKDGVDKLLAGGARIRSITTCSADLTCRTVKYYYVRTQTGLSSGVLTAVPKYGFRAYSGGLMVVGGGVGMVERDYFIRTSNSLTELFGINGMHIKYSEVRESVPGNGNIIYSFSDDSNHPDLIPSQKTYMVSDKLTIKSDENNNEFPFTPYTSRENERGLLLSKKILNQSNETLLIEENEFDFELAQISEVKARKVGIRGKLSPSFAGTTDYWAIVGEYSILSKPVVLKKIRSVVFDQMDPNNSLKSIEETVAYDYVPFDKQGQTDIALDLLPRKIEYTSPFGDKMIIRNKYPNDYVASEVANEPPKPIRLLQLKNMDNALVETVTSTMPYGTTQEYTISGELNFYNATYLRGEDIPRDAYIQRKLKLKAGYGLVDFTFSKVGVTYGDFSWDPRYTQLVEIEYKDYFGNPLSVLKYDGSRTLYRWDTNSNYLESSVVNVGSNEQRTSFEYKPLVGVTKVTDYNLISTDNEYDNFQQMKLTRDDAGNIVKFNSFNNRGIVLDLSLSFGGAMNVNTPVNFYAGFVEGNDGATSYEWKFGDGNTQTTNTGSVTHTYSSSGNFTVEVTRLSSFYGKSKAIKQIQIYSPQVTICASGPIRGDLCRSITAADAYGTCPDAGTINWSSLTKFKSTYNGGCSAITYTWEYKLNSSSSWVKFGGSSSSVTSPFNTSTGIINVDIRCTVVDSCGNSVTSNLISINFFKSNSSCITP